MLLKRKYIYTYIYIYVSSFQMLLRLANTQENSVLVKIKTLTIHKIMFNISILFDVIFSEQLSDETRNIYVEGTSLTRYLDATQFSSHHKKRDEKKREKRRKGRNSRFI